MFYLDLRHCWIIADHTGVGMFSEFVQSLKGRVRKSRRRLAVVSVLELLETRDLLSSVTVNLSSAQDGTLYEQYQGNKANGAGAHFFVGPSGSINRRGLIQFDIADAIPEGAVITDVTLTLHNSGGITNSRRVFLHPVTTNWGTGSSDAPGSEFGGTTATSGDATWLHTFYEDQHWTTPGGDFEDSSADISVTVPGYYEWSSEGLIEDVQRWVDDPGSNNGWLLRSNESARSIKRFDSGEHSNQARRPDLQITYELPVLPTRIEGQKWLDENVNGFREPTEELLNGWTIELYDVASGELVDSTVTSTLDLNEDGIIDPVKEVGVYSFTVTPGTYEVREVLQPDWAQAYPGFAADFGAEGRPSASGGLSLSENVLFYDFDVDVPNGASLTMEFYVPDGAGGQRLIETRPVNAPIINGRISGRAILTPTEIGHLLSGELTVALVNTRGRIKGQGQIQGSGSHIVTVSSNEIVTGRDFGNYRLGQTYRGPIFNPADGAQHGIHFGRDDDGQTRIVISPPRINSTAAEGELGSAPITARQIVSMLNYLSKRDADIASAVDRLFAGEDPLEILV